MKKIINKALTRLAGLCSDDDTVILESTFEVRAELLARAKVFWLDGFDVDMLQVDLRDNEKVFAYKASKAGLYTTDRKKFINDAMKEIGWPEGLLSEEFFVGGLEAGRVMVLAQVAYENFEDVHTYQLG